MNRSRKAPRILSTIQERLDLFERYPLDGVFVVRFDEKVRNTDYRDFIKEYLLDAFDMRSLVLGYDCHFGRNREGGPESVQAEGRRHGFEVKVVPPLQIDGQVVSSTFIRGMDFPPCFSCRNVLPFYGNLQEVFARQKASENHTYPLIFQ